MTTSKTFTSGTWTIFLKKTTEPGIPDKVLDTAVNALAENYMSDLPAAQPFQGTSFAGFIWNPPQDGQTYLGVRVSPGGKPCYVTESDRAYLEQLEGLKS